MYISRVEIVNFRNFKNLDVYLSPNTVILGENNAGKSNFLHALRLVLDPNLPNSARYLDETDFWSGIEPLMGNKIQVTLSFSGFESNAQEFAAVPKCFSADGTVSAISYIFAPDSSIDKPNEQLTLEDYSWSITCANAPITGMQDLSFQRYLPFELLSVLRNAAGDLETWHRSPLSNLIRRLKIDKTTLEPISNEIDALVNEKLLTLKPIADLDNDIRTRLDIMTHRVNHVNPKLGLIPTDPDRLLTFLRLYADDGERFISEIGTGYANIMLLVLLLLDFKQREDVGEKEEKRATTILGVEEPEAHLHPHLQRQIFQYLFSQQQDNIPIFVTTHSPHIASVSSLDSILLLKRYGDRSVGKTVRNAGLTTLEIEDIERYLDTSRAELLFSSGVIFVEGIAEVYIVTKFANLISPHGIDAHGISLVNVNGTDFAPYLKLVSPSGLDIPFVVITDGDPRRRVTGIRRAKRLLDVLGQPILRLPKNHERSVLGNAGIFVGEHTLEIDLANIGYREQFLDVFRELGAKAQTVAKVSELLATWTTLSPKQKEELPLRIERFCGKGRFAQHMVSKLDKTMIPDYIKQAIQFLKIDDNPA